MNAKFPACSAVNVKVLQENAKTLKYNLSSHLTLFLLFLPNHIISTTNVSRVNAKFLGATQKF